MVLDYAELGFKCGIEIHQQVDSHKLFCPGLLTKGRRKYAGFAALTPRRKP